MLPFVRVTGEAPSHVIELANKIGRKYAGSLSVGVTKEGDQKYLPATEESYGYGFIVRPFSNRVDVILIPPSKDLPVPQEPERGELLTLVHGPVYNTFIKDDKPVSVYSPLSDYSLESAEQITISAASEAGKPAVFPMPIDNSAFAKNWSHLIRVRPSMYTGHLREVVQVGLGIGYGSDKEDFKHDFKSLTYRLGALKTDGLIFADVSELYEEPVSAYERMQPVAVQITPSECLFSPLLYWDEAYSYTELRDKKISAHQKWREYAARVKAAHGDTLVKRIIDTYGGIPTPESPFEVPTTIEKETPSGEKVPDKAKAREQRIKAGVYVKYDLGSKMTGWSPVHNTRSWAFAYDTQMAVQVQAQPQGDFPKHRLVTLTFKVKPRKTSPNVGVPVELLRAIDENIQNKKLDAVAAYAKVRFADPSDLASLAGSFSVDAFDDIEVPEDRLRYSVEVEVAISHEMTLFNPVVFTPHGTNPSVHFKFPGYWDTLTGCNTWLPVPTVEKLDYKFPEEFGQAPVDAFFTKEGEMVLVECNSTFGDGADYIERSAEPPDCYMLPFSMSETLVHRAGGQMAGLNLYSNYSNTREASGTDTVREMTYLGGWAVKVGYRLDRPDLGYCWKTRYAISKNTVKKWNGEDYTAAHCAPFYDREIAYLAEPRSGRTGVSLTISHNIISIDHPVRYGVGHCFPGWWHVNPQYFQCGGADPEGVCPSYPGQHSWWESHKYPTLVTDGPYIAPPSPCDAFTGTDQWMSICQDALVAQDANPMPNFPPLPADVNTVPANDYKAKVMVVGTGVGRGVYTLYVDHSPTASISTWWDSVSPDSLTNLTAILFASNNCSGLPATTVDKSFNNTGGIQRFGAALKSPLKDHKHLLYVGVAIKREDDNG